MWPPTVSGGEDSFKFSQVCTKYVIQEKARQKKTALSFDNLYHALSVQACFDCGKQNQNLPRECKKLSFPPRFSLFRALRYALVGVGKKKKNILAVYITQMNMINSEHVPDSLCVF